MYLSSVINSLIKIAERSAMMDLKVKIIVHVNPDKTLFEGTIGELDAKYRKSHVFGQSYAATWRVVNFNHIPIEGDEETPIYNCPILISVF